MHKAPPLLIYGFMAAAPFATFGASPENRLILIVADVQLAAIICTTGEYK